MNKLLGQVLGSGAAGGFAGGLAGGLAGNLLSSKSGRKMGKKALRKKNERSGWKAAEVFYSIAADQRFRRQKIYGSMILILEARDAKRSLIFIEPVGPMVANEHAGAYR